jgi:hypothetical protein
MKRFLLVEIDIGPQREFLADTFVLGAICDIENLDRYAITVSAREVERDVED